MANTTITAATSPNRLLGAGNYDAALLPLHNYEAEQAVLGAILIDPSAFFRVEEILSSSEYFSIQSHQLIYNACYSLFLNRKPIDAKTVADFLIRSGKLEVVGGSEYLNDLGQQAIVGTANVDSYAEIIRDYYQRRQVTSVSQSYARKAYDLSLDTESLITEYKSSVLQDLDFDKGSKGTSSLQELLIEVIQDAEDVAAGKIQPGITTGFRDLDAILSGGLEPGSYTIVAARPSMGKSSFVSAIARYNSEITGKYNLFFTLEVPKKQATRKILASMAGESYGNIKQGRIQGMNRFMQAAEQLSKLNIIFNDTATTVAEMTGVYQRVASQVGAENINIVAIDYLQLMNSRREYGENRNLAVTEISKGLQKFAQRSNVPVIALSQLSRNPESRNNKRPLLSDLRESGSLEQDASGVIFLYRDDYYNPDSPDRGITEVIMAKNRNGPCATIQLLWDARTTTFRDLAPQPDSNH